MNTENTTELKDYGWDQHWRDSFSQIVHDYAGRGQLIPARVVQHTHHHYTCLAGQDYPNSPGLTETSAQVSGRFQHRATLPSDYPTVGDWVAMDGSTGRIELVLPRRSAVARHVAGEETLEQVIVANADHLFVVLAMDGGRNFSTGLLERALVTAWNSGAAPVVILNKCDLADPAERARLEFQAESSAGAVPVVTVSAQTREGIDQLFPYLTRGATVAMLGKSGVGKSALTNALLDTGGDAIDGRAEVQSPSPRVLVAREGAQRQDAKGRHTTTDKQLYRLPTGALMADVPGLRELQLWADDEDLDTGFPDIAELAENCRFRDCTHKHEPGCAVREALEQGQLDQDRFERYQKMQRELQFLERRRLVRGVQDSKKRWKAVSKEIRELYKNRQKPIR